MDSLSPRVGGSNQAGKLVTAAGISLIHSLNHAVNMEENDVVLEGEIWDLFRRQPDGTCFIEKRIMSISMPFSVSPNLKTVPLT